MYRLTILTAIGSYLVEMVPDKEDPTNDDLMKLFLDTKSDIEAGCFMEGWTPEDNPHSPPGVFALGNGLEILAYHVQKITEISVPYSEAEGESTVLPLTTTMEYLGNRLQASCVQKDINGVKVIICYSVNGETPPDVLETGRLTKLLSEYLEKIENLDPEEYLLYITDDEKNRNFSQAVEMLEELEKNHKKLTSRTTAKAWEGWKGGSE